MRLLDLDISHSLAPIKTSAYERLSTESGTLRDPLERSSLWLLGFERLHLSDWSGFDPPIRRITSVTTEYLVPIPDRVYLTCANPRYQTLGPREKTLSVPYGCCCQIAPLPSPARPRSTLLKLWSTPCFKILRYLGPGSCCSYTVFFMSRYHIQRFCRFPSLEAIASALYLQMNPLRLPSGRSIPPRHQDTSRRSAINALPKGSALALTVPAASKRFSDWTFGMTNPKPGARGDR